MAKNPGTTTSTTVTRNPSGGKPVTRTRIVLPNTRNPASPPKPRDDRPRSARSR